MTSSASDAPLRPTSRESTPPTTGSTVARKVWLALNREGIAVARCTVERLMAELGLSGATRGKTRKTTIADPTAVFPADHCPAPVWATGTESAVGRRPDCVSTWWGFAYVALVVDAYARQIWAGGSQRRWPHRWSSTRSNRPSRPANKKVFSI